MNTHRTFKLLNINISTLEPKIGIKQFKEVRFTYTPNIDHLFNLLKSQDFYQAYSKADYLLCDSRVLSFFVKILWNKRLPFMPGVDFFEALCEFYKEDQSFKIFLLGGTTQVHTANAVKNLTNKFGNIISGAYCPPFGFENDDAEIDNIINLINTSKASVLAVGIGSPKQELFINKYENRFPHVKHFIAIGATIDFQSGLIKRAPKFYKNSGLEWFYRFCHEPKRLFKRYFINDITIIVQLILFRVGLYKSPW